MGLTVRLNRKTSIARDCAAVSSAPGIALLAAFSGSPDRKVRMTPETAPANTAVMPKPPSLAAPPNGGLSQIFSDSRVFRARARLCKRLYCVW